MFYEYQGDIHMTEPHTDALWREFPGTLLDFEERFATEEACRDYLAKYRCPNGPRCAVNHDHVWPERDGHFF